MVVKLKSNVSPLFKGMEALHSKWHEKSNIQRMRVEKAKAFKVW